MFQPGQSWQLQGTWPAAPSWPRQPQASEAACHLCCLPRDQVQAGRFHHRVMFLSLKGGRPISVRSPTPQETDHPGVPQRRRSWCSCLNSRSAVKAVLFSGHWDQFQYLSAKVFSTCFWSYSFLSIRQSNPLLREKTLRGQWSKLFLLTLSQLKKKNTNILPFLGVFD
jgi:hypothetical protein